MYTLDPTQLTAYFPRHAEDQVREESDAPGALAHRPQQSATLLAPYRTEARTRRCDRRRRRGRVCDRAARKGLIHKNNAARQKSRLAALVKRLKEKASA